MRLGRYTQTNSESKRYDIDYSEWLSTGEVVSSVNILIDNSTSPSLTAYAVQILNAGTAVAFMVAGGVIGERYVMSVEATTSIGQVKEDKIYFSIVE